MVYVALLRGINVGGANKVGMKELKALFEEAGMSSVRTYINTGNVIFSTPIRAKARLTKLLEASIADHFGFEVRVLVRDVKGMRAVVDAMPARWKNDQTMKCDVIYLWKEADRKSVLDELEIKPDIEDVVYVPGAVIWRVDRKNATKSGLMKLVGTPLYQQMTIRNCNTARKLLALMES
jgi:uncharacterized protein (DUF1697 family)